jgi:tetratricopeptide (TPR) repeat protein
MPDDPTSGPTSGPPSGPWGSSPSFADFASAGLDKARAFLAARNTDAAIREAEKVLEQDPDGRWGYQALDLIGDAHYEKSDYVTVIKIGRELLALDPERIEGYVHLARGSLEREDMRTCIEAIERGLERYPNSLSLILLNSIRFRRCHDTKRAIEWGEKAASIAPWHPGTLNTLGFAYAQAERQDDAKRLFDEARALDPMSSRTVSTAAIVAFADNRFVEAQDLALQALALDPQDEDAAHVAYRARWFKSPLMRPFWATQGLTTKQAIWIAVAIFAVVALIPMGAARVIFPGVALYYAVCLFVVLLVQAMDDPTRPKKPPTLKDY